MIRIAEARDRCGMSQQVLAERLGTTQQQLSRWESGERDPKSQVAVRIAHILDVPLAWMLGADDDPGNPNLTLEERHLLDLWHQTDERTHVMLLAALESQRGSNRFRTAQGL